ncbi:xylose isomerase-like TIM barrel domain-containing protein [Sarocladium implicatum]|nr:xylose isomerase-like TIM barrel domain-containing protein [Sarocladium implicatum]
MAITYNEASIPASFASCSFMSSNSGNLVDKMRAIRKAGFDGMELSMPDLLSYASDLEGRELSDSDLDPVLETSSQIKALAGDIGLRIMMLQPFARFEGWPKGSDERRDAFERAERWFRIMEAVGTDMLQIGSSDAEAISSSFDDHASDLAELADLAAARGLRIAYENWCWASHASTWKEVWQIVKKADRPNLGLCLDTFQSAGGEVGDPTTQSGYIETVEKQVLEARWKVSLAELAKTVPPEKIFLLQISDAYKMDGPIEAGDMRPRCAWSHDYRPLPCAGGYLPVAEFLKAVLKTGFKSWLSMEVFDSTDAGDRNAAEYADRAMMSLKKLVAEC